MTDDLEAAKERAWLQLARIDADLARGRIDEYGWHAAVLAIVQPAYLSSADPRAQSDSAATHGTGGMPDNCSSRRYRVTAACSTSDALTDIS